MFLRNILPENTTTEVTNILDKINQRRSKENYYIGSWGKSSSFLFKTNDTIFNELSSQFIKIINLLKNYVLEILKFGNNKMRKFLEKYNSSDFLSIYPTVCFNFLDKSVDENRILHIHPDKEDTGTSLIFYFGKFKGGAISFPELNFKLMVQSADVLLFDGKNNLHAVESLHGKDDVRYSVVFFAHKADLGKTSYPMNRGEVMKGIKNKINN
ncbi:hypothetical protein NAEGRDRAFT_79850 [Naegleria gruberi]|uniref:Fe2OG dioxygenase domain-containing protein n=1 Tax=Naegleria gruberi TaxID=5762 RepID=D2VG54_NAEGR|nr:uncharacterized protein NAEGRDRAFT_79850 [Naegleria gruberi]EFC44210.1 hypothetical protein NAEGRDRAFT_79850 [Naegleria gruberi]|eukprot:XP_002676954.1 hypothetical protein NAEGRDRAFT_79850 [Naegleria gruberi strain NEG-M]